MHRIITIIIREFLSIQSRIDHIIHNELCSMVIELPQKHELFFNNAIFLTNEQIHLAVRGSGGSAEGLSRIP